MLQHARPLSDRQSDLRPELNGVREYLVPPFEIIAGIE
jgi:hypothetical protein